jgi:integrase
MPPKKQEPARGLFARKDRWWLRVKLPGQGPAQRSTGARLDQVTLANSIAAMLDTLTEQREYELLRAAHAGKLPLLDLYADFCQRRLGETRNRMSDEDVEPYVAKWAAHMAKQGRPSERQQVRYINQLRVLVPEGEPLMRSKLTAAYVEELMGELEGVSDSTKRRYFDAFRAWYKFLRLRVDFPRSPFDGIEAPKNNAPRGMYWEWATVQTVLGKLEGEARIAMTLILGTGMECGAALATTAGDVQRAFQTVYARGTKDAKKRGYRSRDCFVRSWAWPVVEEHTREKIGLTPLFTITDEQLRDAFYRAQADAGVCTYETDKAGRRIYSGHHTIHDCRHTFCYLVLTGEDGDDRKDLQFCADQLGHGDTVMVSRIYAKYRIKERLAAQAAREAAQPQAVAQ